MGKANPNVLPPHQSKNAMEQQPQPNTRDQLFLIQMAHHCQLGQPESHAIQPPKILAMEPQPNNRDQLFYFITASHYRNRHHRQTHHVLPPHQSENTMKQQSHIDNQLRLIWNGAPPFNRHHGHRSSPQRHLHYNLTKMSTMSKAQSKVMQHNHSIY